ncbi:MAG: glycosyltransferase family 4 protein [Microthrixaceae bacterium]|nr:glycosyltransferase family 4 protein [Microthrixaceae bacterium]
MRILFVVQRYGAKVAGGAEALTRMFAERLVVGGHRVSVLSSAATDYRSWVDDMDVGTSIEHGVTVHRCHVPRPRDAARFAGISARTFSRRNRPCSVLEGAWMCEQGPIPEGFATRLLDTAADHDVIVFMTYLYATTVLGLPLVAEIRPTVLYPAAHDEAPFRLPSIRRAFDLATGIACSTEEESDLVARRFRPGAPRHVIGIGFDPPPTGDPRRFRERHGLGEDPYLIVLGRIDPNKGSDEAASHLLRYRAERNRPVRIVFMGMGAMELPTHPAIVVTGFVEDRERWDGLAGATALVQPSYQESFSMALAEAWQARRPALVQGQCAVLDGFARRSRAALSYRTYSEFAAALDLLIENPDLGPELGETGAAYVDAELSWPPVLARFEDLLKSSAEEFRLRQRALRVVAPAAGSPPDL